MNYELIDSGGGRRLEKWGKYILDRPDPEVLWQKTLPESEWELASAKFENGWENIDVPEKWEMEHNGLKFWAKLTPFKHTGIFPEQESQWDYIYEKLKDKNANVLCLFAYTGVATIFAAKAGATVTHVDASKPAITWANENRDLNGMQDAPIRWIVDDVSKFVAREVKRGVKYDAIIMDPPVYGHGTKGETWDFGKDFPKLLENCRQLLSDSPLFVLVNAYAVSSSSTTLANTLQGILSEFEGSVENGELILTESSLRAGGSMGRRLSTSIWARWDK